MLGTEQVSIGGENHQRVVQPRHTIDSVHVSCPLARNPPKLEETFVSVADVLAHVYLIPELEGFLCEANCGSELPRTKGAVESSG